MEVSLDLLGSLRPYLGAQADVDEQTATLAEQSAASERSELLHPEQGELQMIIQNASGDLFKLSLGILGHCICRLDCSSSALRAQLTKLGNLLQGTIFSAQT